MKDKPIVLFVHGMGRTPLSGWPLLQRLRRHGLATRSFGYSAALADFDSIVQRLAKRLQRIAAEGDYLVVGHSLGGVLLRAAMQQLPPDCRLPLHVYLLGSPVQASRMATRLRGVRLFRWLTGDCGQLLGSPERMQKIAPPRVAATGIAGVRGITHKRGPFGSEANDGVVSLSEVSAPWLARHLQLPLVHTWLPASAQVADIILQGLDQPQ